MEQTSKIFFCYSLRLRNFLKEQGLRYEFSANNPNNDKPYWGYLKTDELSNALTKWSDVRLSVLTS
jgi:hypothetical protein